MGFTSLLNSSSFTHVPVDYDAKLQSLNNKIRNADLISFKYGTSKIDRIKFGVKPSCSSKSTELVEFDERNSANEIRLEINRCYKLIHQLGRGVIYVGSARPTLDHPHYKQTLELSREIANLLNCTTWTGAGPGLMDAAIKGALQAGKLVGGFKIEKEACQWSSSGSHPYLPAHTYLTCRFFSARKHGFVDAVVRNKASDRTAVIALPGGIGTLDEIFEILALIQLQRIGSELPVPFLVMNYDGYYSKLLEFLQDCERWGTLAKGEVDSLWTLCETNEQALSYLARFYNLPSNNEN